MTRDGQTLNIWMTLTALFNDAKQPVGIATTERDITDRKQGRQICFFENRALKALNHWYETLLDHPELLAQSPAEAACRMLVKEAGYRLAWIGKVEQDKRKTITPVAWAGIESGDLNSLVKISREAVERALSSRGPVMMHNLFPTNSG